MGGKSNDCFYNNVQTATNKALGQDFLMAILNISRYFKNMHNLSPSSGISPVTKMNMNNQICTVISKKVE